MTDMATNWSEDSASALLCLAGRARIAVLTRDVQQVMEYFVSAPLPLAGPFVGGLGWAGAALVVSVAIDPLRAMGSRRVKGVLLRSPGPSELGWAIEVREVRSLVELAPGPALLGADHRDKPSFIAWRKTRDESVVGCIDVAAMIAALSHRRLGDVAP